MKSNKPEPIIAEATGYSGARNGIVAPLIEMAVSQAVNEVMALGIFDDTPAARVEELTGVKGMTGTQYIVDRKGAAHRGVLESTAALRNAHESAKATELHAKHTAKAGEPGVAAASGDAS